MGILQARILEWFAMPSSRGTSQPRDQTQVSWKAGGFFTILVNSHTYTQCAHIHLQSLNDINPALLLWFKVTTVWGQHLVPNLKEESTSFLKSHDWKLSLSFHVFCSYPSHRPPTSVQRLLFPKAPLFGSMLNSRKRAMWKAHWFIHFMIHHLWKLKPSLDFLPGRVVPYMLS